MTNIAPGETKAQGEALIAHLNEGVVTLTQGGRFQYANRAALEMHGAENLTGLGEDAAGYRERFRLVDLDGVPLPSSGYPADRLLRGERFSLQVKVFFGDEERVQIHRGEPLSAENSEGSNGNPTFVLFVQDITARHNAERRFERAFSSNPAPALICRLSDLRYIKVDRSFLEMMGFKHEEIIGRTAYEFDAFAGAENRDQVVQRFHEGQAIKPVESFLATQAGSKKFVIVGGQPLEFNDEPCMLLTFVDIDERKRMEDSLRQSEARFSKTFHLAPVAAAISFLGEDRFFDVNRAFKTLTGYGEEAAIGRTGAELGLWSKSNERLMTDALEQRRSYESLEVELRTEEGNAHTVQVSAETILIDDNACVLRMFHDVSEWKRTEADLIDALNQVMADPTWLSTSVAQKIMNVRTQISSEAKVKLEQLTKREQQVFALSARGLDNDAVASDLGVAKNTVRNYVASLYKKLGVHSRSELMVWAKRNGVAG